MKGTITFAKFYVRGALPDSLHEKFLSRIRARGFKPLSPEDEDDASVGWVPIERPYDDEVSFRAEGVFIGEYLNLAIRIDRWKFPAALIKARMDAAMREYKQKSGKERLSKLEKAELREAVEKKLRRDGVPVSTFADLTWSLQTGELRFFGRSQAMQEHLHELFEKTFQLRLLPSGCYVGAVAVGALPSKLDVVEPTLLHVGGSK